VYDVALGVFLKHLIDAAEGSNQASTSWLSAEIPSWRVAACVADIAPTLDENWAPVQRHTIADLAKEACLKLEKRASIPAAEIVGCHLADDLSLYVRNETEVFTAPVIELGRAIIALILGELPEAPVGYAWLYGAPTGRDVIRMQHQPG